MEPLDQQVLLGQQGTQAAQARPGLMEVLAQQGLLDTQAQQAQQVPLDPTVLQVILDL
jgi:hypothetical protein